MRPLRIESSLGSRLSLAVASALLTAAALPGCTPTPRHRSIARTPDVTAAVGDLRSDGSGLILYVGTDDPSLDSDEGLFELVVAADGDINHGKRVIKEGGAIAPRLALSAGRAARSAWIVEEAEGAGAGALHASSRDGGGAWGAVEELDGGTVPENGFELAGDDAGRAVVVWESDGSIVASVAEPGLPFAPSIVLFAAAAPVAADSPRIALNGAGRGVVACHVQESVDSRQVVAWTFDPVAGFAPLGRVDEAPAGVAEGAVVAAAPDGGLAVAWSEQRSSLHAKRLVRRIDAAGAVLPVEEVAPETFHVQPFKMRFAADGALWFAWVESSNVEWVRSPAYGDFEPRQHTSVIGDRESDRFDFACEANGRVTCVGGDTFGAEPGVNGARYADAVGDSDRTWLAKSDDASRTPSGLALLEGGPLVLAMWIVDETLELHAWLDPVALFDVHPLSPEAGDLVRLDATDSLARSTQSVLSRFLWDFDGDGVVDEEEVAPIADHTFAVGGNYSVTLRVVDEWGDFATFTEPITVHSGDGAPWELVVSRTGVGSVSSDVDGDGVPEIDCPNVNVAEFGDGEYVFLRPVAGNGYVFGAWEGLDQVNGDGNYGVEGCVVHMIRDRAVRALFVAE